MTTINEALTPLGDGFRNLYGISDKLSAKDMTKLLSGLQIHNLLGDGQFYDSKVDDKNNNRSKNVEGINTVQKWNEQLKGKTVTMSFDVEWSGFVSKNTVANRVGFEFNVDQDYYGAWCYPKEESGKTHICNDFLIKDVNIDKIWYRSMYNQLNYEATVKMTNLKIVVNPLGGVVPANLLDTVNLQYNGVQNGSLLTFDSGTWTAGQGDLNFIATNIGEIKTKANQAYKLRFKVRGKGTVITYVFGNTRAGYVDNAHYWYLTSDWKDYEQTIPIESVPTPASFNFRAATQCSGEITELQFIPI
ncbi:hypothetical protein [Limosilactobacillus vaginalis]|uniref:hypothetical protein n=1 Tax=Limosilactobacillus vaginalis TaxID=1633 RepID=UPI001F08C2B2|nr:hypothetical protein [Limosilactobacillus vaginalis]